MADQEKQTRSEVPDIIEIPLTIEAPSEAAKAWKVSITLPRSHVWEWARK